MDDEGYFTFGFDRDDNSAHYLQIKFSGGKVIIKKLTLPKREYKIQRINNMKSKYVSPPDSELVRISREREIIKSGYSKLNTSSEANYKTGFTRPVAGGRITGVFGSQRILNGIAKDPHNGLDIAAPSGTPVYAMSDGIVQLARNEFYYTGNFILLDHGHGLTSRYLHLSKISVKEGTLVKKGDLIGLIGTTGRSTGPHLHWSVQWYNKRIDPQSLLMDSMNFSK